MNTLPNWLAGLGEHHLLLATAMLVTKATILLVVAWCAHGLLDSANPRWRVLLWRSVGVGMVLLMVLTMSPPLVHWGVLPAETGGQPLAGAPAGQSESPSVSGAHASSASSAAASRSLGPGQREGVSDRQGSFGDPPIVITRSARRAWRSSRSSPAVSTDGASIAPTAEAEWAPTRRVDGPAGNPAGVLFAWGAGLWLTGLVGLAGWTLLGLRRLRAIVRRATPVPEWVGDLATAVRDQLGCRRQFELRQTSEVGVPCLIGVRRPIVLLPAEQCDVARRGELTAVLLHETAHLKGRDLPWNAVLHGLATLFWFHPLAWRIRSAHAGACDSVADTIAADLMGDVAGYGRTLARLAVEMHAPAPAAALAVTPISNVRRRIEALHRKLFRAPLPRTRVVTLVTLGAVTVALLGGVALTRARGEPQPPVSSADNTSAKPQAEAEPAPPEKTSPAASSDAATGEPERKQDRLTVHAVVDETGQPLPGVSIRFNGRIGGERYDRRLETDEKGTASIRWAQGAKVSHLWMTCSKSEFVPIHYVWRSERRSIELPVELHLRFHRGQRIGGIVQDEAGQPIEGATVTVTMPIDWPKLANHVFYAEEQTTDAKGRWQWNGAPEDLGKLSIRVTHPDYLRGYSKANAGLDAVAVLKQGLRVTGRVLAPDGQPVEGAKARLGFDRFGTDEPQAETDAHGRFTLNDCKPGKSLVTVQADGHSPQLREIVVGEQEDSGEFQLEPGHTMRVRVVDGKGQPIKGVVFVTDTWRGYRSLEFRANTDQEGRVRWESAPGDTVLCDILRSGYMSVRNLPLQASDEEHVVTLPPLLVISGKVTDAATGKPVPDFQVRLGYQWRGRREASWSRDEGVHYRDGTYRYKFDEPIEGEYLLQVVASGYLPSTSRPFRPEEGPVLYDFSLEPGRGLSGTVLTASGQPAAEAQVGLATVENRAMLDQGHFDRSQNSAEVVKTDAAGKFTLPPLGDEPFLLIALHEAGFAELTREQFEQSPQIRLEPWGRIEGQVLLGDEPDADREVSFWPKRPDRKGMFVFSYGYETRTDADGRFRFDRVIPGVGTVSRVVVTEFLKSWQHAPGWQQPVEVKPSETTTVSIGGTGRPVVGRVELDRQPDVAIDWTTNEPATIERWDVESDRRDESFFRCLGNIDKTGRFEIPDVPPGDYRLTIPVNNPPSPTSCGAGQAIGQARHDFAIPLLAGRRSDEPLDLGVITAVLFDTLDPGEIAPDFVAENLSGGQVRLGELHRKLVVLDFWATWCAPCMAQMPTLKEIHRQFGGDERFVLLSLSCDNQIEAPRQYVTENALQWAHAHVSGMYARPVKDYTVYSLPATFLIGPDGRVMAKNLRGDSLKQAVAAALADDELFERAAEAERPPRFPVVRFEPSADAQLSTAPAVVVLDNCDPSFDKDVPHTDGLRLISAEGKELRVLREFNSAETVGGIHGVAVDRERGRFFVRENAADRVLCFDSYGRKLWQVEKIDVGVLAVDPKTGHVWCGGGPGFSQGEIVVLDQSGREVAAYPYRPVDMTYDPHTDAFWLVGYEIIKLDREGTVLFRQRVEGWCCPSVSVNPANGHVWLIERDHPDSARSGNRLWKLDAHGAVLVNRDLEEQRPFAVECDPQTDEVWVATLKSGLLRFSAEGEPLGQVELKAYSLALGGDGLWVTTEEALLKLDRAGQIVTRYPFDRPSSQSWLATFDRAGP